MKSNLSHLTRLDVALAGLSFVLSLALYIRTLAPGLLLGDSAEFQTLTYTLGMTHPTGYPVYLLLSRLFTLLPTGNLAQRVNLFSAVLGAFTLALLYLAGRQLVGWRLAALTGSVVLGLCPIYWFQAVIAELYTAAAAFLAGILVLLLLWRQTDDERYLFVAGMLGGLSLGVHNTVALAAPAVLVYLLLNAPSRKAWGRALAGAALGLVLSFAAFAFLDARDPPSSYYNSAARHALSVWGLSPENFDTLFERLDFLYAARQFRPFMFSHPAVRMPYNIGVYWDFTQSSFSPGTIGLAVLGLASSFIRRRWREGILLLLAWLTMLGFILNYDIGDIYVFYIPTYVLLGLVVTAGAALVLDGVLLGAQRMISIRSNLMALTAGCALLILLIVSWPSPLKVISAWDETRLTFLEGTDLADYPYPVSDLEYPYQTAKSLVNQLEDNAIVFTDWGTLYTLYYVAHVEQGRTGMAFHETHPQDDVPELADTTLAYIDASLDTHPIYFLDRPEAVLYRQYTILPVRKGVRLYQLVGRK
jgi:hypothetical protein